MGTTSYESQFPSGLMEPEYQLERRTTSPETVAAARLVNKIQAELRRTQEVIGVSTPTGSGIAWPSGTIHQMIINIMGSGAAGIPFAGTPGTPEYEFIRWFLDWMGIWDWMAADGTPSTNDILRALWQNKYDVEILFEPRFLVFGTGAAGTNYIEYDMTGDVPVWAGLSGMTPSKPIGGFCDLSGRPYPLYSIYDDTDDTWLYGNVVLQSGHHLQFHTSPGLAPPNADDYMIQLYGNSPYQYLQTFGSGAMLLPTGLMPGSGDPPQPVPPPPPPLEPVFPGGPGSPPPYWEADAFSSPVFPTEINRFNFSKDFDVFTDVNGNSYIASTRLQVASPGPLDPTVTGAAVMIPGSFQNGVNTAINAARVNLPLSPGWNAILVLVTGGNIGGTTDDLHLFLYKSKFNNGEKDTWPPTEIDFDVTDVTLLPNESKWVFAGYTYCAPEDAGSVFVTVSQEGMSPDNIFVVAVASRAIGNSIQY